MILFSLVLWFLLPRKHLSAISFSPKGNWTQSKQAEKECVHEFLCSWNNLTWYADNMASEGVIDLSPIPSVQIPKASVIDTSNKPFILYNSTTGCQALLKHNIRRITFHGDSYMRQMYTGMFLLLSGNYRNGTLLDNPGSIGCEYYKQLYEKRCGVQQLNHNGFVCDNKVHLDPLLYIPNNMGMCSELDKVVVLLSTGNHKTKSGYGGRWGVNNATIYQEYFENTNTCPSFRANTNKNCSTYWITTHYRIVGWFGDETPEYIQTFNEEMRQYVESGKCGDTGYVDVYNMTRQLAVHWPHEASTMTFDRVHWGMQVNLLKAIFILNAILSNPN